MILSITGYYDPGPFGTQVAKTPTCFVVCPFSLFVALCDRNPSAVQTDRPANGRAPRSQHKTSGFDFRYGIPFLLVFCGSNIHEMHRC